VTTWNWSIAGGINDKLRLRDGVGGPRKTQRVGGDSSRARSTRGTSKPASAEPVPANPKKVSTGYLESHGIDGHRFKRGVLGDKAPIAQYNIFVDKNGALWLQRNNTNIWIPTFENINDRR